MRSMMGRAWRNCSDKSDYTKEIILPRQRLVDVGHDPENLTIIFKESATKLQKLKLEKSSSTKIKNTKLSNHQRLFLHRIYHQRDISRKSMQEIYYKTERPSRREKVNYRMPPPKEHQGLTNSIKTKIMRRRKE